MSIDSRDWYIDKLRRATGYRERADFRKSLSGSSGDRPSIHRPDTLKLVPYREPEPTMGLFYILWAVAGGGALYGLFKACVWACVDETMDEHLYKSIQRRLEESKPRANAMDCWLPGLVVFCLCAGPAAAQSYSGAELREALRL